MLGRLDRCIGLFVNLADFIFIFVFFSGNWLDLAEIILDLTRLIDNEVAAGRKTLEVRRTAVLERSIRGVLFLH